MWLTCVRCKWGDTPPKCLRYWISHFLWCQAAWQEQPEKGRLCVGVEFQGTGQSDTVTTVTTVTTVWGRSLRQQVTQHLQSDRAGPVHLQSGSRMHGRSLLFLQSRIPSHSPVLLKFRVCLPASVNLIWKNPCPCRFWRLVSMLTLILSSKIIHHTYSRI